MGDVCIACIWTWKNIDPLVTRNSCVLSIRSYHCQVKCIGSLMIIVCFGLAYAYVWSYMNKKFLVCCYLLKRGKLGGVQEWVRWEREGVSKLVGESGDFIGGLDIEVMTYGSY